MDPNVKSIIDKAYEIEDGLIETRRYIHKNAEVGYNTVKTSAHIKEKLEEIGVKFRDIDGTGIVADIGFGEKTILLRADMDALPMYEINDLEFKSNIESSHCCGHDLHATMLLGAAKILKEREADLKGTVRLMFQPDEEGGAGAKRMLDNGVLKDRNIDAALALHVDAKSPLGTLDYGYGKTFASNDSFEITVNGRGGHGARAYETIDPINIAINIYNSIYNVINREVDPFNHVLFSVTSIEANSTFNIIPDSAKIKGTLRTYDDKQREYLLKRFETVTKAISQSFMSNAEFKIVKSLPALTTSKEFTNKILKLSQKLEDKININVEPVVKRGSEDFSYISEQINNNAYLFIGAGKSNQEGYEFGQHNSNVIFNEEVLPIGSALLSAIAYLWLL
ncbi:M20 family metallopeptidase [Tissierella praeacuta]|uniref:M20 family metallopeptidase n=1 Tax=Tissierella praeacuta TaxID=43131 RepID=UPI0033426D04